MCRARHHHHQSHHHHHRLLHHHHHGHHHHHLLHHHHHGHHHHQHHHQHRQHHHYHQHQRQHQHHRHHQRRVLLLPASPALPARTSPAAPVRARRRRGRPQRRTLRAPPPSRWSQRWLGPLPSQCLHAQRGRHLPCWCSDAEAGLLRPQKARAPGPAGDPLQPGGCVKGPQSTSPGPGIADGQW